MRRLASSAAISLVLAATAGLTSSAARVERPALLTFVAQRSDEGPWRLCLARRDGTRRVHLTRTLSRASWSPDGQRFVFVEYRRRRAHLAVGDGSGRVVRRLGAPDEFPRVDPVWSPDGRWIAVRGGGYGGSLGVIPARGGRWRGLVSSRTFEAGFDSPTWTPDARRLAFSVWAESVPRGVEYATGVHTIGLDGGEPRLVVAGAQMPAYAPDGSQLAYVLGGDVVVSHADGSNPRNITSTPEREDRPAWSPDGRSLAFSRLLPSRSVIVIARADGSRSRVAVSSSRYDAYLPSWRPPGSGAVTPARRRPCA